jgi:hypothetical protein
LILHIIISLKNFSMPPSILDEYDRLLSTIQTRTLIS